MKRKSGQILILVLLIVIVALAVGLSVASRNITNLKTSTQTEHSQRAFSAAEGGIEDILSRGQTQLSTLVGQTVPVNVGNIQANVTVSASTTYGRVIDLGDIGQIDLSGTTGILKLEWAKLSDESENPPASIEITIVREDPVASGLIKQSRKYYQGASRPDETGTFFDTITNCLTSSYTKCTEIDLNSETGTKKILRIKPFWVPTTLRVSSLNGSLPNQTYEISSTATSELGLTRKVQVTKTALPQLPAVFDYALFSENEIVK